MFHKRLYTPENYGTYVPCDAFEYVLDKLTWQYNDDYLIRAALYKLLELPDSFLRAFINSVFQSDSDFAPASELILEYISDND